MVPGRSRVADLIRQIYGSEGIPLDMTHTGKAFYGMVKYLEEHKIQENRFCFFIQEELRCF